MQFEFEIEGKKTHIELKGLKGKVVDKLFDKLIAFQNAEEKEVAQKVQEYRQTLKDVIVATSGLSVDQIDNLDADDRAKLFDYVNQKVKNSLGFSNLLSQ
jgi:uncharacterized protein YfkK (UPF0435 family)